MYGEALCTDRSILFSDFDPNVLAKSKSCSRPSTGLVKSVKSHSMVKSASEHARSRLLTSLQRSQKNNDIENLDGTLAILTKLIGCMKISGICCRDLFFGLARQIEQESCVGLNPLEVSGVGLSAKVVSIFSHLKMSRIIFLVCVVSSLLGVCRWLI